MTITNYPIIDRESWLARRRLYLNASEIAAAAGCDPYKGALQLFLEKTGKRPAIVETPLMRRGRLFEPAAEAYLREELPGWRIVNPQVFIADDEHRIGCTPDRLLEDPDEPEHLINCQIKIVGRPEFERWEGNAPLAYQLQCAQENMLLSARYTILACLVVGSFEAHLETFRVPRHAEAEARIYEIAADFWDRVEHNRPYDPDYRREAELVEQLYPVSKPVEPALDLTSDNRIGELLESREKHKAAQRAAEAECEAIDAEIIAKLGGHQLAYARGWKITRKMQHRDEYTIPAKDFPVMRVAKVKEAA